MSRGPEVVADMSERALWLMVPTATGRMTPMCDEKGRRINLRDELEDPAFTAHAESFMKNMLRAAAFCAHL